MPTARSRPALAGLVVALVGESTLAHQGAPLEPHDLWSAWTLDPAVLFGVGLAGAIYARGVAALWRRAGRGRGVSRARVAACAGGLAVMLVALVSPLGALSSALLSAHMVQHLLLILVAAPLLVVGASPSILVWALPASSRRVVGSWWRQADAVRRGWRGLTHPASAWALHAAIVWVWHLPPLYQGALTSVPLHALEHLTFLGSAAFFWWVVVRCGRPGGLEYGLGMLYVFAAAMQGGILGALMALSGAAWYPDYAGSTLAWGASPLEDQQLAGLLMWVPAGSGYLIVALVLLARWASAERWSVANR